MKLRNGFALFGIFLASVVTWVLTPTALSDETAIIYSVFKGIDLGNPNDAVQKDYFVNLGTNQGVRVGTVLEVARKSPSYDLTTEKLYKDLIFPFAQIKIIHAEKDASIARLEKLYSPDKTPVLVPRAVIVGDLVKISK
ncbi:MAG: hypothetical protein JST04_12375 [Bdellovibrionales bacterium]|nr:hypothetical protein [Bdellovibrionales bacterium]